MRVKRIGMALALLGASLATAQTTRQWRQSTAEEFARGEAKGVAVNSRGWLELAPKIETLATPNAAHLWGGAVDAKGDLWAVGGTPAKLYRLTAKGALTEIALPREMEAQALAIAPEGGVYVATQPGGKIYKVLSGAPTPIKAEKGSETAKDDKTAIDGDYHLGPVFYAAPTQTIWALSFDAAGKLYVATGDKGEIYRVGKDGKGELFFHCAQPNIRSLAWDGKGNLLAGTDGGGRIYSIAPDGKGFVLYVADKPEITAIAARADGVIYAAAVGERKGASKAQAAAQAMMQEMAAAQAAAQAAAPEGAQAAAPIMIAPPPAPSGGSQVVRIGEDGARQLWSARDESVYALAWAPDGRLLAATGNKGKLLAIDEEGEASELGDAPVAQITALVGDGRGGFYALGGNAGQILRVDFAAKDGEFESEVFDAHVSSRWGRIDVEQRGAVEVFARSGNVETPGEGWSEWRSAQTEGSLPAARYAQYKLVLKAGAAAPRVEAVTVNYLPAHQRPQLGAVEVFLNSHFAQASKTVAELHGEAAPAAQAPQHEQGRAALRWSVRGEAERLSYTVEMRGAGEERWLTLKRNLATNFLTIDATLIPDGVYSFRVTASDGQTYAPNEALTAVRESATVTLDNTPPVISSLTAERAGKGAARLRLKAVDALTTIERAEYSLDAGMWTSLPPVGGLSDAKAESYDAPLSAAEGEAHVVAVRVCDRAGNCAVAKAVVSAVK